MLVRNMERGMQSSLNQFYLIKWSHVNIFGPQTLKCFLHFRHLPPNQFHNPNTFILYPCFFLYFLSLKFLKFFHVVVHTKRDMNDGHGSEGSAQVLKLKSNLLQQESISKVEPSIILYSRGIYRILNSEKNVLLYLTHLSTIRTMTLLRPLADRTS